MQSLTAGELLPILSQVPPGTKIMLLNDSSAFFEGGVTAEFTMLVPVVKHGRRGEYTVFERKDSLAEEDEVAGEPFPALVMMTEV